MAKRYMPCISASYTLEHCMIQRKTLTKEGENGRQPRPNGLVVSAGKCAGPIPAENCANAQKIHPAPKVIPKKDEKTKRTKNGLVDHG
jgi:hypothetical protein